MSYKGSINPITNPNLVSIQWHVTVFMLKALCRTLYPLFSSSSSAPPPLTHPYSEDSDMHNVQLVKS
jgi:hypothetical protein